MEYSTRTPFATVHDTKALSQASATTNPAHVVAVWVLLLLLLLILLRLALELRAGLPRLRSAARHHSPRLLRQVTKQQRRQYIHIYMYTTVGSRLIYGTRVQSGRREARTAGALTPSEAGFAPCMCHNIYVGQ